MDTLYLSLLFSCSTASSLVTRSAFSEDNLEIKDSASAGVAVVADAAVVDFAAVAVGDSF